MAKKAEKTEKTVDPGEYTEENVQNLKTESAKEEKAEKGTDDRKETLQEPTKKYATDAFNVDHTQVRAPYVRLLTKRTGDKGDVVSVFDIRICQPNMEAMDTSEVHTLEHILSEFFLSKYNNVIGLAPIGDRTGFYLTMFGELSEETLAQVVVQAMQFIALWNAPIPGATPESCGNFQDHDLLKAKKRALMFIGGVITKGFGA